MPTALGIFNIHLEEFSIFTEKYYTTFCDALDKLKMNATVYLLRNKVII